MAIYVLNGPFFDNYGSKLSYSGQHFGPSVGCYCLHSALIINNDTVGDCVKLSLTCGVASMKVKGQGHLKTKVNVTKNYEKAFFAQFLC